MQQTIGDASGRFQFRIEIRDPVLREAIGHDHAEDVLKCAVLMALSALAEAGPWPGAALESMSGFMNGMKNTIIDERFV
jgi:hypothetical protein